MSKNRTPEKEEEKEAPEVSVPAEGGGAGDEGGGGGGENGEAEAKANMEAGKVARKAEEEREARLIAEAEADAAVMIEEETRLKEETDAQAAAQTAAEEEARLATEAEAKAEAEKPLTVAQLKRLERKEGMLLEKDALEAFYEATDGDGWRCNDGWGSGGVDLDMDVLDMEVRLAAPQWHGVSSDGRGYFVRQIFLERNRLEGPIDLIPFDHFKHLTALSLSHNKLDGPLPVTLADIENLRVLNLSSNEFTGQIPGEFGNLGLLTHLWLTHNRLTGPIPSELASTSGATSLSSLRLNRQQDGAGLSGTLPPGLGSLSRLQELVLSDNSFRGSVPPTLTKLQNLRVLHLEHNMLDGSVPLALRAQLSDLTDLRLFGNNFSEMDAAQDGVTMRTVAQEDQSDVLMLRSGKEDQKDDRAKSSTGRRGSQTPLALGNEMRASAAP